ncbi:MAG: carboxylate--amine ligase [Firmicutes bacterium]|nr:carboxylate--amine ligase [Bacillota bacterium]
MKPAAVILGANYYTPLGAIRTLGRRGVRVYALDYHFPTAYALASKYVYQKVLCPNVNQDEEGMARFLIEWGKQFDERPVLMAGHDSYALLISRYAQELAPYYRLPDNPPGLLEEIINKKGLYRLSQKHGLRMPLTFFVENEADLAKAMEQMRYPCLVKPALSHEFVRIFRSKCLIVREKDTLAQALSRARSAGLEVMVQEIIPGFDDCMYVFDAYINAEGRATHTFTAQKLRQFPINFGSSTLTHHCYDPEVAALGLEYMQRLGYRGYGEIEFKRHAENGKLYMIEINARLSSLNVLFDKCGMEFAYIHYRDLIGEPLPDYHLREEKPWAFWHAYEDFLSSWAYLKSGQLGWRDIIRPWLSHRKAHAIWAADDLLPLFAFGKNLLAKLLRKAGRLLKGFFTRSGRGSKGKNHFPDSE